jgi:hypothetical protein
MPTFHNNPHAALFTPEKTVLKLDFTRRTVCRMDTTVKNYFSFDELPKEILSTLTKRTVLSNNSPTLPPSL